MLDGERISSLNLKDEEILSRSSFEDIWGYKINWMDPKDGKYKLKIKDI